MKREAIRRGIVGTILMAIIIVCCSCCQAGLSEESATCAWVLCKPDSYVNIREKPSGKSAVLGRYESGTALYTDGIQENGYIHLVHLSLEAEEGWIHKGYVVYGEPEEKNAVFRIRSNGRVAARKNIDGKRRRWLKNGDRVKVYRASRAWAVTSKGFIQTKYLEEETE